jgi:hypothetical protein
MNRQQRRKRERELKKKGIISFVIALEDISERIQGIKVDSSN